MMVDGQRVNLEQCPGDYDMESGDQIDAMAEQQGGLGQDPAAATAAALRAAGFERPTLLTGSRALAVVADTSGLHMRARQAPGRVRTQILPPVPLLPRLPPADPLPKLAGEAVGGGRNCAPRRNVFHCASHTLQCALP